VADRSDAEVEWDDEDDPRGNVQHIALNDLTPDEVESVLLDPDATEKVGRKSKRPFVEGYTYTDRFIVVVYEVKGYRPLTLRPVTAFEPDNLD